MAEGDDQPVQGNVEQAWGVLGLVNEWLKHAETKAAGALTAAGVVGGVLYTLVADVHGLPFAASLVALLCGFAVLASGTFAALALWPRLKSKEAPTSPLYFNHIARQHADVSTYHDTLKLVTSKPEDMVKELAAQIWANAHVSHKKFRWAGYSIAALIVSLAGLAIVAAYLGDGMDSNYKMYNYLESFKRIDEILDAPSGNFEEVDNLPDRDRLTFNNGFYANCTALFIDIRGSSGLPGIYNRPALAKLYRAFISEMVAIFNGSVKAREINIVGDCVWGVYRTPYQSDINDVFSISAEVHSLTKVLNYKLNADGYSTPLRFGIGLSWGRALMIKAGYSGSGINDVVYMGDVVNQAAKLAAQGSKGYGVPPLMVDGDFQNNLNDDNKSLLQWSSNSGCYQGNVVNVAMEDWYVKNCV